MQYDSGFVLPPGKYHLKFVVRENQTGRMGSFETDLTIPDLKIVPLKMSSVVLASQIQPASKRKSDNPLVRDGSEVIPSVTHVFSTGQHLYFYYEVYDPARAAANAGMAPSDRNSPAIRLLTNVAFFQRQRQGLRNSAGRERTAQRARPPRRRLPARCAAHPAQARLLHLPGQCD